MPKILAAYEKEKEKCKEENLANVNNPDKMKKEPKKRFLWSEEVRKLLKDIIVIKKRCYVLEGIRKETFEDHLETFLKVGVICLWPDGWMSIGTLMKHVKNIMDSRYLFF